MKKTSTMQRGMYSTIRFQRQTLFILLLSNLAIQAALGLELTIPIKCRTEGKVTLLIPGESNLTTTHHLAFTESLDTVKKRSAISIGYVSHALNKYFFFEPGSSIISLGQDGICRALEKSSPYVPELAWFVELMFAGNNLGDLVSPHNSIGPTGLLGLFLEKTSDRKTEFEFERMQTHRNVPCQVFVARMHPEFGKTFIKYELFVPQNADKFKGDGVSYFSVQATSFDDDKYSNALGSSSAYNYKMIIDYYDIDSMDGDDRKYEELQQDFNLPLASGCSELLPKMQPFLPHQTFTMKYYQISVLSEIFMAYDHVGGYLRKDLTGKSVSIWDLNEDYMYHIDVNSTDAQSPSNLRSCSVLKVTSETLGPAFRPYKMVGESLDVLGFLGAGFVTNMGRETVRDLPCLIFETVLKEPPSLFALSSEQLNRKASFELDYIVTYYIVESARLGPNVPEDEHQLGLLRGAFWPARIILFRRYKESGKVELLDSLEIFDFYSSIRGWSERPSELFTASNCFEEENDQVRIELDVKFPLIHEYNAKPADKAMLTHNKFKLETDLIDNIFEKFSISRMHLIDYELKLKPHHVDLDLIIADRKEAKNLVYKGPGKLPNENSYEMNRVIWFDQSEESCVTISSLLEEVSMVIYCPVIESERSSCIAVYDENSPSYERFISVDATKPTCHVYRYEPSSPPSQAGPSITRDKFAALKVFNFEVTIPGPVERTQMLEGTVNHFDISHETKLITIGNYMFSLDPPSDNADLSSTKNVRHFDSLEYKQQSDCAKLCNLDATCKSYSYCTRNVKNCVVSTLDLRSSMVKDQLVQERAPIAEGNSTIVQGSDGKYKLESEDGCSIYERDYLSMFSQTDEIISLSIFQSTKYRTASTTFECAKQSVDLELSFPDQHVAMFAYCARSSSCLLDQKLFESNIETDVNTTQANKEILCSLYRKKYQFYFEVSAEVLKQNSATVQVELALGSVEECARACWNRFGKVCVSFDYCNPGSCLINQIGSKTDGSNSETRPSCLHYDRNLKLDELRRKHLIGRHEYLELEGEGSASSSGGFWSTLLTISLVLICLVVGLKLGVQVDDKMNKVRILRQSASAGPGIRSSQMFGNQNEASLNGSNAGYGLNGNNAGYGLNGNNAGYGLNGDSEDDFRNAIRMDVIRDNQTSQDDDSPLNKDF